MSNAGAPESSAVKRALVEVRDLRARLERHERARSEAIAITGVGVRLPGGVATCDQYWDLLREGRDAISEVPRDRWDVDGFHDPDPDAPGRIATRYGGFLDQVDAFDPRFFGITPREAVSMDPQQRLLLEVAWEALEHAGQAPDQLAGQPVGVFVGLSSTDYLTTELKFGAEAEIDAYLATGGHPSVASGRLSYVLGLQGPALTVDTACSSSLAAIHLAVQSLRGGECRMALAGGVSLMLMPELSVNFSRARMMAPDGRCKTFDRRADGYVRSEGCGVVVLKRLSDAVADGDRVLAVVRGTALNQDGRSSGLTVPNGPAQEAVIRDALRRAGVRPADVDYVEAHGTGTALGDPVELRALGQVFRDGRTTGPLAVGSVKTNLGHLEAAAGVAGLIKVVLALQHETIPQHLHLQEPTPHVDWARLSLSVPTSPTPWRRSERPRLAGVSAFGFSGTNAHVVVGEAPDAPPAAVAGRDRPWHLLAVSGKTVPALRTAAARLSDHLATTRDPLADICHTAAAGRAHFAERAALVVRSIDEARVALDALAAGREHHAIVTGPTLEPRRPEVAFLFAGQGTQYAGMGRGLFESQPVFRRTLQACEEILRPHLEQPLLEVLYPPVGRQSPIDETAYAQPVLFAFEYALAEMWRSWGVDPTMVLGHSLGEDVAACVAGVFPVEDGLRMVAERARVMEAGLETGAMAAVFAPEERVRAYLAGGSPSIEIAALNGPHHVVISGPSADVARLVARIESDAIKVRPLTTARACHSALMDPVLDELEQLAARMSFSAPHLGLVSTLTGRLASATEVTDPRYWRRHVRETVRYTDALQTLCDEGIRLFVEIGPNGTLTGMARRCSQGATGLWLPSLKRDDDWQQVLATLGALHARGVPVNWSAFDAGYGRRKVTLPPSPFERSRYWSDAVRPRRPEAPRRSKPLGRRVHSPVLADVVYQSEIGLASWPLLADHRVHGAALAPAAFFAEMALAAAGDGHVLRDLAIHEPLALEADGSREVQLVLGPTDGRFTIFSAAVADGERRWTRHATGRAVPIDREAEGNVTRAIDRAAIAGRCPASLSADAFYAQLADRGLVMGPGFRAVQGVLLGDGEALGEIELPAPPSDDGTAWRIHPVIGDACFQVAAAAFPEAMHGDAHLMAGLSGLTVSRPAATRVWSHVRRRDGNDGADVLVADLTIFDDDGAVVAEIEALTFRRAAREAGDTWASSRLYELAWRPQARPDTGDAAADPAARHDLPAIAGVVTRALPELAATTAIHDYGSALDRIDRLATTYVVRALQEIGVRLDPGTHLDSRRIAREHGVVARATRALDRFLRMLAEDGVLDADGDGWIVRRSPEHVDESTEAALTADAARLCEAELTLTTRCGAALGGVLQGRVDPVHLLFPGGSMDDAERVYQVSPAARLFNALAGEAVASVARSWPAARPLRILEVGAGTGSTTAAVLPALPPSGVAYTFTDVSPLFLQKAGAKFEAHPFVDYRVLDIEQDPTTQGFADREFDVVIAVNVLHATGNLTRTLTHVRRLLAPGGLLLAGEATVARRWLDVTFGLTDGWWKFDDLDVRPAHPLLDRRRWLQLLDSCGFTGALALPAADAGVPETQALLLASAPHTPCDRAAASAGRWLVLADAVGVGDALVAGMRARGLECVVLRPAGAAPQLPADGRLDPGDASAFDLAVLGAAADGGLLGCVNLWGLDAPALDPGAMDAVEEAWAPGCYAGLHLVQALIRASARVPVWTVTAGAVAVDAAERVTRPAGAALWGLGRVVGLEHPELWGGLVDVDVTDAARAGADVLAEIADARVEDQIAIRAGRRFVARLAGPGHVRVSRVPLRRDGAYLVTGGLGRLGLEVARWMAAQGAGHLTLVSRTGLPDRARWNDEHPAPMAAKIAGVRAIESHGCAVTVVAADVADARQMAGVMNEFGGSAPPLRGVVHAASATGHARVVDLSAASFRAMMAPKVTGAIVLQSLCAAHELDFLVLFSSTTGLLGSVSMGHYAAANTVLDALASAGRSPSLPVTSIAWGAWEHLELGSDEVRRATEGGGLKRLTVQQGLDALGWLLRPHSANPIVVDAHWPTLKAVYEARRRRPLLDEVGRAAPAPHVPAASRKPRSGDVLRRLQQEPASDRRDFLSRWVLEEAASVLGIAPDDLDPGQGLFDLGMDSLMSVELKGRLERGLDCKLPTTLTFNYPSVAAIVGYLDEQVLDGPRAFAPAPAAAAAAPVSRPAPAPAALDDLSEDELAALLAGRLVDL